MTPDRTGVAFLSLLVGAAGAPALYVVSGVVAPKSFVNFPGLALLTVAPIAFIGAYLFSAALAVAVGGLTWRLLHKLGIDGFLSYVLIAVSAVSPFLSPSDVPPLILMPSDINF